MAPGNGMGDGGILGAASGALNTWTELSGFQQLRAQAQGDEIGRAHV